MDNTLAAVASRVSPTVQQQQNDGLAHGTLGKEDFMKLLIAQLEKQDPLNPQDPTEFTAQLAQFSSLEQLIGINQGMEGFGSLNALNNQMLATSTIGKIAQVNGTQLQVNNGQATTVQYTLGRDAAQTLLNIYNAEDQLVAQVNLGNQNGGSHAATWNGLDMNGNPVADGEYQFEILATDSAEDAVAVETQFAGVVSGVRFGNDGTPYLEIGGGSYTMDQIIGLDLAP